MLYFSEASRMKYIFKFFDDASTRVDTPIFTNIFQIAFQVKRI